MIFFLLMYEFYSHSDNEIVYKLIDSLEHHKVSVYPSDRSKASNGDNNDDGGLSSVQKKKREPKR